MSGPPVSVGSPRDENPKLLQGLARALGRVPVGTAGLRSVSFFGNRIAEYMTQSHFACNLDAFDAEERQRYASLTKELRSAIVEKRELDDSYAFRLAVGRISPTTIVEWIALEQKCCPFFGFDLRFEADQGPVWLLLTGRIGVKDIIRDEFT